MSLRWRLLAVFAAAALWMGGVYALYFRGANTWEFANYAEIARNIRTGHGFSTRVLYPSTLAFMDARGLAHLDYAPVIHRFPLTAALSALSQAVLGESDFSSVFPALGLYALWVTLLYAAAYRWLGPAQAPLCAGLLAVVPAGAKYFALFNLPDVPFGVLLFVFHWALAELPGQGGVRRCAALGALGGLLYLCRYNYWIWLPFYLGYLTWALDRRARFPAIAAFLAALALTCAPALWYNQHWFSSWQTPDVVWNIAHGVVGSEQPWLNFRTYDAGAILSEHWPAIARKALDRLHTLMLEGPMLWQLQALLPFLALGAARWPAGAPRRFLFLNAAAFVIQAAAFAPLRLDSWGLGVGYRYLFWLCPVLILVGAHGAAGLAGTLPARWRTPALAVWLAVHAAFVIPFYTHDLTAIHLNHPSGLPPRQWPELVWLRERTAPEDWVVSNLPAHVAWYAGRGSVGITNDPEEVRAMGAVRPLRYLLVSVINIAALGDTPRWIEMLKAGPESYAEYWRSRGGRVAATFPGAVIVDLRPEK